MTDWVILPRLITYIQECLNNGITFNTLLAIVKDVAA